MKKFVFVLTAVVLVWVLSVPVKAGSMRFTPVKVAGGPEKVGSPVKKISKEESSLLVYARGLFDNQLFLEAAAVYEDYAREKHDPEGLAKAAECLVYEAEFAKNPEGDSLFRFYDKAVELFEEAREKGVEVREKFLLTYALALNKCTNLFLVEEGQNLIGQMREQGLLSPPASEAEKMLREKYYLGPPAVKKNTRCCN